MAMDAARVGIWDSDETAGATWWSEKMWELLLRDRSAKPFTYKEFVEHVHPDDREAIHKIGLRLMKGELVDTEFRMTRGDGTYGWFLDYAQGTLNSDGRLIRSVGACMDITARKTAQFEREDAEQQFRHLVDSLEAVVWEFDWDRDKFTYVSQYAQALFGYPVQAWLDGEQMKLSVLD